MPKQPPDEFLSAVNALLAGITPKQRDTEKARISMKRSHNCTACLAFGVLVLFSAGCEPPTDSRIPPRDQVSGAVTLDGDPIDKGSITFFAPDDVSRGIQASTSIKNGKYELLVTPGKKKVKISKVAEIRPDVFENIVPAKYNSATTLEADVSAGNQQFDFELKSK